MPEGDKDQQDQNKGDNAEELLKNLNLTPEQVEKLKADQSILSLIQHNVEQKRSANEEAKKLRLKLEAIEADKQKAEEEDKKKKGEFEDLYKQTQEKLSQTEERYKKSLILGEVKALAAKNGIKKSDYLKLFDTSTLTVDENMQVIGAEEQFGKFVKDNPELFGIEQQKPSVPNGKPNLNAGDIGDDDIEKLKKIAEKTKKTSDIARYQAAVRKKNKK